MKWLKKVSATPLTTIARVVDSLQTQTNERTNAPSIRAVREAVNDNWLTIYPVGSIYMSVNNVNPSTIFGGTWQQIKDKFLLASGDTYNNGTTGGSATNTLSTDNLPSHTHTYDKASSTEAHELITTELPSHNHGITSNDIWYDGSVSDYNAMVQLGGDAAPVKVVGLNFNTQNAGGGQGHSHSISNFSSTSTGSVGSATPVNNMPPYLAVNVWVRTA